MAFNAVGKISEDGIYRSVQWENGTLTGDVLVRRMVSELAVMNEGRRLALPTSRGHTKDHLSHGESVMVMLGQIFLDPAFEGDTAFVEPVEEGVIA